MLNGINTRSAAPWPGTSRQVASTASRHIFNQHIVLKIDALYSAAISLPGGGMMNAHVFKADNFSPENPVMLVKGRDVDGTYFETEVNINDLNRGNLSFVEMFALDGYFRANGKPCGLSRSTGNAMAAMNDVASNAFTQFNVLPFLQNHMETQRIHGNWAGFNAIRAVIDNFLNHFA